MVSKSLTLVIAGSIIMALLLVACGDETTPTDTPPTPLPTSLNVATAVAQNQSQIKFNVCSLLSSTEVGILVGDGAKQEAKAEDSCSYTSTDGKATLLLKLTTTSTDAFTNQKKQIPTAPASGSDAANGPQVVPGLGDDAFWDGNALYVLSGTKFFSLAANGSGLINPSSLFTTLKLLGRKAASRLQFSFGVTPTANK